MKDKRYVVWMTVEEGAEIKVLRGERKVAKMSRSHPVLPRGKADYDSHLVWCPL